MLGHGGHLHEDAAAYERRYRTEVGLRKGEFLRREMVMEEEVEAED